MAGQPWGGGGLDATVSGDNRAPGGQVGVALELGEVEDGRHTGVDAGKALEPFGARTALDEGGQRSARCRPSLPIELAPEQRGVGTDRVEERPVELRFHGTDRQPPAVGAAVATVVR